MASLIHIGLNDTRIRNGILAGLLGGIAFGILMTMLGMMPMVAMLVGSASLAIGWILHLAISAAFGAGLAILTLPRTWGAGLLGGVAWGLVLWIGAAMVVMRLALGAPIALDDAALMSLMGHVLYGAIAGAALAWRTRAAATKERGAVPA